MERCLRRVRQLVLAARATAAQAADPTIPSSTGPIAVETVARVLVHPWSLAFLPNGRMSVAPLASVRSMSGGGSMGLRFGRLCFVMLPCQLGYRYAVGSRSCPKPRMRALWHHVRMCAGRRLLVRG